MFGGSFFFVEKLPMAGEVYSELDREPRQSAAGDEDIVIEKEGYRAELQEVYEYEIQGLVVEDYISDNWLDVTHEHDPFNTRDLCLVWGDNINDLVLEEIEFSHGEFTCFYQTRDREAYAAFNPEQLSNNHLIPANEEVEKLIERTRVGDQVRIAGSLVELEVNMPDGRTWSRGTSVTRNDSGNGACELIYVRDLDILAATNQTWRFLQVFSFVLGLASLLVLLTIFVAETVQAYYGRVR